MENIRINGISVINGGEYDSVKIFGSVKVLNSVKANEFITNGRANVLGSVTTIEYKSGGSSKIEGDLKAGTIKSSGAIKIQGECSADLFVARGSVNIDGDCNIDTIDAKLTGGTFHNIYGDNLTIMSDEFWTNSIYVKDIEATKIRLKNVYANVVRGDNIIIEAGCKIDVVEYSSTIQISQKAKINRVIKN